MEKIRTVFGTVVYHKAYRYVNSFVESLNEQRGEFDVLIINDDCTIREKEWIEKNSLHKTCIVDIEGVFAPSELRIELIAEAKRRKYDLLILGDCDDIFDVKRVKRYQEEYSKNIHFLYNKIIDFNGQEIMGKLPIKVESIDSIIDYNFIGLTNSGLNLNQISFDILESMKRDKTDIFDWYFFSRLILNGAQGKLVQGTNTNYRVHDNNIAGIVRNRPSIQEIKKELIVKIQHYEILEKYCEKCLEKKRKCINYLHDLERIYDSREWIVNDYFWWCVTADIEE